jgi:hypothetical protein
MDCNEATSCTNKWTPSALVRQPQKSRGPSMLLQAVRNQPHGLAGNCRDCCMSAVQGAKRDRPLLGKKIQSATPLRQTGSRSAAKGSTGMLLQYFGDRGRKYKKTKE